MSINWKARKPAVPVMIPWDTAANLARIALKAQKGTSRTNAIRHNHTTCDGCDTEDGTEYDVYIASTVEETRAQFSLCRKCYDSFVVIMSNEQKRRRRKRTI